MLTLVLNLLYTTDIHNLEHNTIAIFADDTCNPGCPKNNEEAGKKLQTFISLVVDLEGLLFGSFCSIL